MKNNGDVIRGFTLAALDASHGFTKDDVDGDLLVVKNDRSILQLGLCDSNTLAAALQIRKDDGVHMAWKKFSSLVALDTFLDERKRAFVIANLSVGASESTKPGYIL